MVEQADGAAIQERKEPPVFIEKSLTGDEASRCVDGRKATASEQGPQLLGGSILPIFLSVIDKATTQHQDLPFNEDTVTNGVKKLGENGISQGVHRDEHAHGPNCGCGFCDQLKRIFTVARENRESFTTLLKSVYQAHPDILGAPETVDNAYQKFNQYTPENIQLTGEPLVALAQENGAKCEVVEGDHGEEIAFLNLKKGVTLNTQKLNAQGRQAFNLDLIPAVEQAKSLGVNEDFAKAASLILYLATEKVLVQDKGKPALAVAIYV